MKKIVKMDHSPCKKMIDAVEKYVVVISLFSSDILLPPFFVITDNEQANKIERKKKHSMVPCMTNAI
jgi:hypothetical protein